MAECCELKLGTGQQGTRKMARRLYQSWPWAPWVTGRSGRHLGDRKQVLGGGTARVVVMGGGERGQARTSFLAKGQGWTVTTSRVPLGGESADQGITAPGAARLPQTLKLNAFPPILMQLQVQHGEGKPSQTAERFPGRAVVPWTPGCDSAARSRHGLEVP